MKGCFDLQTHKFTIRNKLWFLLPWKTNKSLYIQKLICKLKHKVFCKQPWYWFNVAYPFTLPKNLWQAFSRHSTIYIFKLQYTFEFRIPKWNSLNVDVYPRFQKLIENSLATLFSYKSGIGTAIENSKYLINQSINKIIKLIKCCRTNLKDVMSLDKPLFLTIL